MIEALIESLKNLAKDIPVELFAIIGSFVEEVLAPIPSPIVMTLTGSLARAQGHVFSYLFVLSLLGALGKTLGAVIVYFVARVIGDAVVDRYGRYFGVSKSDIERVGKRFNGTWKDHLFLTFFRALPIMSSSVVSVVSGVLKVRFKMYVIDTFIGTIIRDFFYLYVGFTGVQTYYALVEGFDSIESFLQTLIAIIIVLFLGWLYWRRKRGR